MNTNKVVQKTKQAATHSPPIITQHNQQEMIKTSFHNHLPSVTPHSYDISQSPPPPSSASIHASGMHLASLSRYDTSSVPASSSFDRTTQQYNYHHAAQQQQSYDMTMQQQYQREHVNLHQHRYHPYQQRNPISPPSPPRNAHRGGLELHNCNTDASGSSNGGTSSGTAPMHVYSNPPSHYHHHVNNQNFRASPTSNKKSPISSEQYDTCYGQSHDVHSTAQQPLVSNNRKKIPNRSSYETHVFMNAPSIIATSNSTTQPTPQKRKNVISKQEMIKVLHLPQTQASSILGCSLSTLKRRFYELKEELGKF
ncbi:predicted protein [Naegleria gruberi]|uniref:Predicted protein n=1 Tax=Naegleria gruberi TaxID=5762 RepID=D2V4I0_NAEGR|nr:uncharacterized protein NAEGRDRAFT_46635 [Naegleria gruberi]EFC48387.1 predicted protein [Naegleria gruberi]|eukprot:XP_002681131.1 predicted protein [Naegleria gruberi strain NEG-M]